MLRRAAFLFFALIVCAAPARSAFHLWEIKEVYSNANGSIQYIELFTSSAGETQINGHTISATAGGVTRTFTFNRNLTGSTASKHLLIATTGFASLPGAVTPDFTLPCGPFFNPGAATIVIDFPGADSVTFTGASLPKDGTNSITDTALPGTAIFASGPNSPTNFTGSAGALALTGCRLSGTCSACDDGLFCNGAEACTGSACVPGTPCALICDEASDTCTQCTNPSHCNDNNPCTNDVCTSGTCSNPNNSAPCNDGLFCTATDACSGGQCRGSGTPCTGQRCNETTNACVECLTAADCNDNNPCTTDACTAAGACTRQNNTAACNDGLFCTTSDVCSAGQCRGSGARCPGQICLEDGDRCVECVGNGDCNDNNVCTNDVCTNGVCSNPNNTADCDDGLFCTTSEACSGGLCTGPNDACPGQNCNEGSDSCGECTGATECDDANPCTVETCVAFQCQIEPAANRAPCPDDGVFCNGSESCNNGACSSAGNPCGPAENCSETTSTCVPLCGNGVLDSGEACDDGGVANGDGCSSACAIEPGYTCNVNVEPSVCTLIPPGTGGTGATGGAGGSGGEDGGGAAGTGGAGAGGVSGTGGSVGADGSSGAGGEDAGPAGSGGSVAGASGASGGRPDAGGGAPPASPGADDSDGCGCRTVSATSGALAGSVGLGFLLALASLRRRKRRPALRSRDRR